MLFLSAEEREREAVLCLTFVDRRRDADVEGMDLTDWGVSGAATDSLDAWTVLWQHAPGGGYRDKFKAEAAYYICSHEVI